MEKYIFILLVCLSKTFFAQTITGIVTDEVSDTPLPYANITLLSKSIGTTTNEHGEFSFDVKGNVSDSLLVSYLGFASQTIAVQKAITKQKEGLKLKLIENKEQIDAVVLEIKKTKYTTIKKIGENKKQRFRQGTQFGYEKCLYIKNERNIKGKVTSLNFYVKKNENPNIATFPTYYRLKFYKFNKEKQEPGQLLSYKDVLIEPENKTQKITVQLEDDHVLFPQRGLCVGIETIQLSNIMLPGNPMYTTTPSLVVTHSKVSNTWTRYREKKWNKRLRKSVFNKKYYANLLIQLKVQYRK